MAVKITSRVKSTCARSGSSPYGALSTRISDELELLGHVGDPALAEAFPGQRIDTARAEHRPHGKFEGAGVRRRYDPAEVVGRETEQRFGFVDREFQARFAFLRPVRPAEKRFFECLGRPAGALGAGAGGEVRAIRPRLRPQWSSSCEPILPDRSPSLGRGVPRREIRPAATRVNRDASRRVCAACCRRAPVMPPRMIYTPPARR